MSLGPGASLFFGVLHRGLKPLQTIIRGHTCKKVFNPSSVTEHSLALLQRWTLCSLSENLPFTLSPFTGFHPSQRRKHFLRLSRQTRRREFFSGYSSVSHTHIDHLCNQTVTPVITPRVVSASDNEHSGEEEKRYSSVEKRSSTPADVCLAGCAAWSESYDVTLMN